MQEKKIKAHNMFHIEQILKHKVRQTSNFTVTMYEYRILEKKYAKYLFPEDSWGNVKNTMYAAWLGCGFEWSFDSRI